MLFCRQFIYANFRPTNLLRDLIYQGVCLSDCLSDIKYWIYCDVVRLCQWVFPISFASDWPLTQLDSAHFVS